MKFEGKPRMLNRFLTIETDFNKTHNNKYDYSNSIYTGFKNNIDVKCPLHGVFTTTPKRHIENQGCPVCAQIKLHGHISLSKFNLDNYMEFVQNYLNEKYPNFCFTNFDIIENTGKKLFIFKCKKHGVITANSIFCQKCNDEKLYSKKMKEIDVCLSKRKEKIIKCEYNNILLECQHGQYVYNNQQILNNTQRCDKCQDRSFNKISNDEFITRVIKRIGNVYNIKETNYKDARTKIKLICDKHGEFEMLPGNLLKGQGCNKCSIQTSSAEEELIGLFPDAKPSDRTLIKPYEIDLLF